MERTYIDALIEESEGGCRQFNWDIPQTPYHAPISARLPRRSSPIPFKRPYHCAPIERSLVLPALMSPLIRHLQSQPRGLPSSKLRPDSHSSSSLNKSPNRIRHKILDISDLHVNLEKVLNSYRGQTRQSGERRGNSRRRGQVVREERGIRRESKRKLTSPAIVRLAPFKNPSFL